jgi:hypothetical protein
VTTSTKSRILLSAVRALFHVKQNRGQRNLHTKPDCCIQPEDSSIALVPPSTSQVDVYWAPESRGGHCRVEEVRWCGIVRPEHWHPPRTMSTAHALSGRRRVRARHTLGILVSRRQGFEQSSCVFPPRQRGRQQRQRTPSSTAGSSRCGSHVAVPLNPLTPVGVIGFPAPPQQLAQWSGASIGDHEPKRISGPAAAAAQRAAFDVESRDPWTSRTGLQRDQ